MVLHGAAADHVETDPSYDFEERVALLAEHYPRSRQHGKAFRYLTLAGQQSLRVYSLTEAGARFDAALALAEQHPSDVDPGEVLGTAVSMSRVHYFSSLFDRQVRFVGHYIKKAEALGDETRLARLLFESGYCHVFSGRSGIGKQQLIRARGIFENLGDRHGQGLVDLGLAWYYIYHGPPNANRAIEVQRLTRSAASAGAEHRDSWLAAKALLAQAQDGMLFGDLNRARESCRELVVLARKSNDTRPRGMALWQTGFIDVFNFSLEDALHSAEEAMRVALSPVDRHAAASAYYAAMVLSGRGAEIIDAFRDLREGVQHDGFFSLRLFTDCYLGIGEFMCGEMAQGVKRIEGAIAEGQEAGHEGQATVIVAFGYAALGELYTALSAGNERPERAILIKNAGFLLRALPAAASRARKALRMLCASASYLRRT